MDVFFFQAEDGIRDIGVTGVQTCALPIWSGISAGTELLCYRGQLDPDLPLDERIGSLGGSFRYPFPYGYSCVGTVERSAGTVPAGTLVFVFHPHQDRFVFVEPDFVALPAGNDPRLATFF